MTDDLQDRTSADASTDTVVKPAPARRRRPSTTAPAPVEPEATVDDEAEPETDAPTETATTPDAPKSTRPAPVVRAPSPANLRRQAKKEMARRAAEARRKARRRKQTITYASVVGIVVVLLVGGFLLLNKGNGKDKAASPAASVSLDPALQVAPSVSGDPTLNDAATLADTKVTTLVKGTGPVVTAGQYITVQYTGVTLSDGKQFDSSWKNGQPATFQIGTGAVISGWDKGLVGVTVGSRVQLDIPQAQAYPNGNGPVGALRFVVDVLAASDTQPAN